MKLSKNKNKKEPGTLHIYITHNMPLKDFLDSKGYTRKDYPAIAADCHILPNRFSKIVSGELKAAGEEMLFIASHFNKEINELF